MSWHLIARLTAADTPTILWKDGKPRDWAPLTQIVRRDGVDVAAIVYAALDREPAAFGSREESPLLDGVLDGRHGARRIVVHHVVCPGDVVFGLQLWVGEVDEPIEPRTRAAGIIWETAGSVQNNEDTWMLGSPNLAGYGDVNEPDQFFTQTVRFDDMLKLIELCANPQPGAELFTSLTLLHKAGHLATLLVVGRAYGDQVRFITMITTPWDAPTIDPVTAMRISGVTPVTQSSCALMSFTRAAPREPVIAYWVTEPPAEIAHWSGPKVDDRGGQGLIHSDDGPALLDASRAVDGGAANVETSVRLRRTDGTWQMMSAAVTAYPDPVVSVRIYIVKFTITNQ